MVKYLDNTGVAELIKKTKEYTSEQITQLADTKGEAEGVAPLDENAMVPLTNLPPTLGCGTFEGFVEGVAIQTSSTTKKSTDEGCSVVYDTQKNIFLLKVGEVSTQNVSIGIGGSVITPPIQTPYFINWTDRYLHQDLDGPYTNKLYICSETRTLYFYDGTTLRPVIDKQTEATLVSNPESSISVDDSETTLTPMRRNTIKGFTNIRVVSSPENIVHAELHNFKPTTLYEMFYDCANLKALDTSQWDTSEVTNMEKTFFRCKSLEQLDLSGWDTGKVLAMGGMFYQCTSLAKLNIQSFDMNGVTSVWGMFYQCLKLSELNLRNFTLPNVTDLSSMFYQCRALTSLDLSACNTSAATTMESMFHQCGVLQVLNIASFDLSSVTTCRNMFYQCGGITSLTLGEGFGKMKNSVGSVDFSAMTRWADSTVQSLTSLYNRKAAGMGVITLKLSTQTKNALGSAGISTLTAKGYTIA